MVSDFIDEHNGFLALSDDEYQAAKALKPNIRKYAREQLKYGESKEGYWTRDKFTIQMHRAVEIAEIKYSKEEGWRHVWVFDHSSCHAAMADDALDVNKMNVKPGGKQRIMRDTTWNGKVWKMYFTERDGKVANLRWWNGHSWCTQWSALQLREWRARPLGPGRGSVGALSISASDLNVSRRTLVHFACQRELCEKTNYCACANNGDL